MTTMMKRRERKKAQKMMINRKKMKREKATVFRSVQHRRKKMMMKRRKRQKATVFRSVQQRLRRNPIRKQRRKENHREQRESKKSKVLRAVQTNLPTGNWKLGGPKTEANGQRRITGLPKLRVSAQLVALQTAKVRLERECHPICRMLTMMTRRACSKCGQMQVRVNMQAKTTQRQKHKGKKEWLRADEILSKYPEPVAKAKWNT